MRRVAAALALLLASAGQAAAAPLGRLFFTPQERAALERGAREPATEPASVRKPPPPVTGFVRRSTGPATLWLGGEVHYRSGPPPDIDPRVVTTPSHIVVRRTGPR